MKQSYFLAICMLLMSSITVGLAETPAFEYISPIPGSKMHRPETNIIIRKGVLIERATVTNATELHVVGSTSGQHGGEWLLSDDSKTLVFNPTVKFGLGEVVNVQLPPGIRSVDGSDIDPIAFSFSVAQSGGGPIGDPDPDRFIAAMGGQDWRMPEITNAGPLERTTQNQDTLPPDFPAISILSYDHPSPDPIFLSNIVFNAGTPNTTYLMILNNHGTPIGYHRVNVPSFDFKMQPDETMTYFQSNIGGYIVMNKSFTVLDTIRSKNGYSGDAHELRILPNGHALLLAEDAQTIAMDSIVPGGNHSAVVTGAIIQELDRSRNVVFQWRSWDYFLITDATHESLTRTTIDYVHSNALDIDSDGNLLLSSRHLDEITKINRNTGAIIWRLGGKHNEFSFVNDSGFSYQHAIRRIANGHITLFDNGNFHTPNFSRAVEYALDEHARTATLVWEYRSTPNIYSVAMGYVDRLPNGNTLIGWGATNPSVTEVTPEGSKVFELTLPQNVFSYRALRFPWSPTTDVTGSSGKKPTAFLLDQNYPNPFNPSTTIRFQTTEPGLVSLKVFDVLGQQVATLVHEELQLGSFEVKFNGANLTSGIYFYTLQSGKLFETRKMLLTK